MTPISVKHDTDVWQRFRTIVKARYDLDGAQAIKRLIDYVVRTGEIPDLQPVLSITSGDYKPTEVENGDNKGADEADRRTKGMGSASRP